MSSLNKGNEIDRFKYKEIGLLEHWKKTALLNGLGLIAIVGGLIQGASQQWLLVIIIPGFWFNSQWLFHRRKENSFPHFALYNQGVEIHLTSENKVAWYEWGRLKKVRLVSPFERESKGKLRFLEGRPGFELTFNDGLKVMAYQRIEGYSEFYQHLANMDIKGVEAKLPIYDRLNAYGQSIDGEMNSINNYGEPASYENINVKAKESTTL